MNYDILTLKEKEEVLFTKPVYVNRSDSPFCINADYLKANSCFFAECQRELFVSLFPMLPILEKTVPLEEANYILYSHPYARVEDMSPVVIEQLRYIDTHRKPSAEIIVVGKSSNAEELLAGSIQNITFWPNHYAELVGKKFGMHITDEYFVYDTEEGTLNIWPVNGCLRKCKFCRRSYMDIPFESLSLEYIKQKLDWYKSVLPEKLYRIRLRAENLTEYGIDIYNRQALSDLIDLVSSYDEVKEIHVLIGLAICEITDQILDSICKSGKFTFVAMNLEAGSNTLLQTIGKEHTRERAIYIAERIRNANPKVFLCSTVMVGLPTETLDDVYELADLCIKTTMNHVQINMYGSAPKYPLNSLPQLSPQLREYHLRLMVKLIKEKKLASENKDLLGIVYERKLKRGSRKAAIEKFYNEQRLKTACLLTWHMRKDAFIPQLNRFVKCNDKTNKYLPYLRDEYLKSKSN